MFPEITEVTVQINSNLTTVKHYYKTNQNTTRKPSLLTRKAPSKKDQQVNDIQFPTDG